MGKDTGISWCHHTMNPWVGCQRVSLGCVHCYAESIATSGRMTHLEGTWGPMGQRRVTSDDYWKQPLAWNRAALKAAERRRVFCGSMCDVFEDWSGADAVRARLWELIAQTPMLDWLLLTKRPENIARMVPWADHLKPWPGNVWLGVSAENQEYADKRIPVLLEIPAQVHFVSYEPALGPILWGYLAWQTYGLDWVIVGGESGAHQKSLETRRSFNMQWARDTRDWCVDYGVAFYFKQAAAVKSEQAPWLVEEDGTKWVWRQFPGDLRAPVLWEAGQAVEAGTAGGVQQLGLWE